jgi:hypothetical protein
MVVIKMRMEMLNSKKASILVMVAVIASLAGCSSTASTPRARSSPRR